VPTGICTESSLSTSRLSLVQSSPRMLQRITRSTHEAHRGGKTCRNRHRCHDTLIVPAEGRVSRARTDIAQVDMHQVVVWQWGPIPKRCEPRGVFFEMAVGTSLSASPHSISHVVF
jgi:hypothetical protein